MMDSGSPKIVVTYRLKNAKKWIQQSIDSVLDLCDEIVIVDASDDGTLEICQNYKKVTDIFHDKNLPFDETRDKNQLWEMAKKRNPDYILNLDGDEILMPYAKQILFEELNILHSEASVLQFQFLEMWDTPNQYRVDGFFNNIWKPKLVKMKNQPTDLKYDDMPFPGNAHCPGIPQKSVGIEKVVRSNLKILHYGNYFESARQNHFEFYNQLDPNNVIFDGYKHLISANTKFSGSDGMKFQKIPKSIIDLL
jgi:glycosyltransferase involved in cell wall biosynthesis